jgi:hypothetical protein
MGSFGGPIGIVGATFPGREDEETLRRLQQIEAETLRATAAKDAEARAAAEEATRKEKLKEHIAETQARLQGQPPPAAATAAAAEGAVVRELNPPDIKTDTSELEVTRPAGYRPPSAPIRAVRDAKGNLVYTNAGTPAGGKEVNYDEAIASIRAAQKAATLPPENAYLPQVGPGETVSAVPGQLGGQMRDVVRQAQRNIAAGREGTFSAMELKPGDTGEMTPGLAAIWHENAGLTRQKLEDDLAQARAKEELRVLTLPPEERAKEKGMFEAAPAAYAGITPQAITEYADAIRKQMIQQIMQDPVRAADYRRNSDKYEATIMEQVRKQLADTIDQIMIGAGRKLPPQQPGY